MNQCGFDVWKNRIIFVSQSHNQDTLKKFVKILHTATAVAVCLAIFGACSAQKKLNSLQKGEGPSVQLTLGKQESYVPEVKNIAPQSRDTLKIVEDDGSEILIMKAITYTFF